MAPRISVDKGSGAIPLLTTTTNNRPVLKTNVRGTQAVNANTILTAR